MSDTSKSKNEYQVLLDAVRQNYASAVWTHKIQIKQADIYAVQYRRLQLANVLLADATSCGAVSIFTNTDSFVLKIITVVFSFATTAVTAYQKSFDLKTMQKQHEDAAKNFVVIRNELLQVIAEIHMQKKDVSDIDAEYQNVVEKMNTLYLSVPSTTDKAVAAAEEALKTNGEYTYTDEEIERFLPSALKGKMMTKENANGTCD